MPSVPRKEAVNRLIEAVSRMSPDDLIDFHNEVFPKEPMSDPDPGANLSTVRHKVLEYLRRGIEVEEILDLWNVAFPESSNVAYDDESDSIGYKTESEVVRHAD
jgi:hypothetical protein